MATLSLMLFAFLCGWVVGGGGGGDLEGIDDEVATMASAEEMEAFRSLVTDRAGASRAEAVDDLVGPSLSPLPARAEIARASNLTRIDKNVSALQDPDC